MKVFVPAHELRFLRVYNVKSIFVVVFFIQSMVVWQQMTKGNTGICNCTALEMQVLQLAKWLNVLDYMATKT